MLVRFFNHGKVKKDLQPGRVAVVMFNHIYCLIEMIKLNPAKGLV